MKTKDRTNHIVLGHTDILTHFAAHAPTDDCAPKASILALIPPADNQVPYDDTDYND